MLPLHFLEDLALFFGLADPSNVASTVREISSSVTPLDTAFRTAFLIRLTAFFCFSFPSAIDYAVRSLGQNAIICWSVSVHGSGHRPATAQPPPGLATAWRRAYS